MSLAVGAALRVLDVAGVGEVATLERERDVWLKACHNAKIAVNALNNKTPIFIQMFPK